MQNYDLILRRHAEEKRKMASMMFDVVSKAPRMHLGWRGRELLKRDPLKRSTRLEI